MSDIKLYYEDDWFSHQFLQRLQNSTNPGVDKCSTSLLEVFCRKFLPLKEELLRIKDDKAMNKVNDILTVELTDADLGFIAGGHPSRTHSKTEKYLEEVCRVPFIIFEETKDGKLIYEKLPLIKSQKTVNGKHVVIYNDLLLNHISPVNKYSPCSLTLLKEIKAKNVVAGILYEEGCRWKHTYNQGKSPFFEFTEKKLRAKFLYDKMELSEDKVSYKPIKIKCMRIDKIRELVLKPALAVLKELFNSGKSDFYLRMDTYRTEQKKVGRPPKKNFRFTILDKRMEPTQSSVQDAVQQDLFDEYEEISNYTELSKELTKVCDSKIFVEKIIKQTQAKEADDPTISEEVLTKIRQIRTNANSKDNPKSRAEWRKILVAALWEDFGIGTAPKKSKSCQHDELSTWPDNPEDKIKVMQESMEIYDKAVRINQEFTQEKVHSILGNEFLDYCLKKNKPLRDWKDATNLFFNVFNQSWFLNSYGYDKRVNDSNIGTESNRLEEEALRNYR